MTRAGTKVPAQGSKPFRNPLLPITKSGRHWDDPGLATIRYLSRVTGFTLVLTLRPRFEEDRCLAFLHDNHARPHSQILEPFERVSHVQIGEIATDQSYVKFSRLQEFKCLEPAPCGRWKVICALQHGREDLRLSFVIIHDKYSFALKWHVRLFD
jgi:hypothetical protein